MFILCSLLPFKLLAVLDWQLDLDIRRICGARWSCEFIIDWSHVITFIYRDWLLLDTSFFPCSLKKNLNTFLLLTTWLKVCNLPFYNYQHNLFGISYRSSLQECVPLGPSYMKIWGLIHREGFRLFLSLPLVTRRLNFFLFFDDTFHISFFFQVQHFDTHPGR